MLPPCLLHIVEIPFGEVLNLYSMLQYVMTQNEYFHIEFTNAIKVYGKATETHTKTY